MLLVNKMLKNIKRLAGQLLQDPHKLLPTLSYVLGRLLNLKSNYLDQDLNILIP